jgi:DNA-binding MarR family transcriptional regulator
MELELLKPVPHLETFLSTRALATPLNLDASTVTRQIAALESGGHVDRRPPCCKVEDRPESAEGVD